MWRGMWGTAAADAPGAASTTPAAEGARKQDAVECGSREMAQARTDEEMDSAIKAALECPCVSGIRDGPCGPFFVAAFTCYHKSKDVIKGAECFHVNVAFAECIAEHPDVAEGIGSKGGGSEPLAAPELPREGLRVNIHATP